MYFKLEGVCEEKYSAFKCMESFNLYYIKHFHADKTYAN